VFGIEMIQIENDRGQYARRTRIIISTRYAEDYENCLFNCSYFSGSPYTIRKIITLSDWSRALVRKRSLVTKPSAWLDNSVPAISVYPFVTFPRIETQNGRKQPGPFDRGFNQTSRKYVHEICIERLSHRCHENPEVLTLSN